MQKNKIINKKKQPTSVRRNSGIELLRIIAMLMIVAFHFVSHGQYNTSGLHSYWLELFSSFGRAGVAIFFIITGYFIATQNKHNWKKVFNIIRPTWFYSLGFFVVVVIFRNGITVNFPLSSEITKSFFPILTNAYWFISSYVILFLLSPIIKKALDALKDRDLILLITVLFVSSFCCQFFNLIVSNENTAVMMPSIAIFCAIIGYAIKRFESKVKGISWGITGALSALIVLAISPVIIHVLNSCGYNIPVDLFNHVYSPACIVFSVSMFVIFSRLKFFNRIINYIASLTLGVYLIHDNIFVSKLLWNSDRLFHASSHGQEPIGHFIIYSILVVGAVFIGSLIIEAIRKSSVQIISALCNIEKIDLKHPKNRSGA